MSKSSPTQEQIDLALQLLEQTGQAPKQERSVSMKHVTGGVAVGGLLLAAVFKFWFGAVSALPFMYTQAWHDQVSHNLEASQTKFTEIEVLKTQVDNVAVTLSDIRKNQDRQADKLERQGDQLNRILRLLERDDRRANR